MNSFAIRIAEINIKINCLHNLTFDLCKDYLCEDKDIDFEISVSEDDEEKEFIDVLKAISKKLYEYNRILIHAAAIEYKGLGYLFIAESGTGKSTHIRLWKEYVKDVDIINGDKPIVDIDGYVYGTPWCGKERWNRNTKVKIGGIIILNRDTYNHIEVVEAKDHIKEILNSVDRSSIDSISIVDNIIKNTKLYKLGCDISYDAVKVCKDVIDNENK